MTKNNSIIFFFLFSLILVFLVKDKILNLFSGFSITDLPSDCYSPTLLKSCQLTTIVSCPTTGYDFCYALRYYQGTTYQTYYRLEKGQSLSGTSYYCFELWGCSNTQTTTTTTFTQTTTTTDFSTTTTTLRECNGLTYTLCTSTVGCEWVGNLQTGYCRLIPPPEPTKPSESSILGKISNIFASIWNWIKEILRW